MNDKVVLVTGGSAGIGRATVRQFASLGFTVYACGLADWDVTADAEFSGLPVTYVPCDVRRADQVNALVDRIVRESGRIDVVVNNAGFAVYRTFEESVLDESIDIVDVNLLGPMRVTKACLTHMIPRGAGHIVNVSSVGGAIVITPNAAYGAAKHGLVAWTRALGYEVHRFGIRTSVVCPDHVKTRFQDHPTFRRRDPYRQTDAYGKRQVSKLTADDVARTIVKAAEGEGGVYYAPPTIRLFVWAANAFPWLVEPIWRRIMRRRTEQLYEQIDRESETGR